MADDTYFKVVLRDAGFAIRDEAKKYGKLFQLYVDPKKPSIAFIKYIRAKDAQLARTTLARNPAVQSVESMPEWHIRPKKTAGDKANQTQPQQPSTSQGVAAAPAASRIKQSFMKNATPPAAGVVVPGTFNVCCTCHNSMAIEQCSTCGTFYCNEACQRADWPGHIVKCMPRLVRSYCPLLLSGTVEVAQQPEQPEQQAKKTTPKSKQQQQPATFSHPLAQPAQLNDNFVPTAVFKNLAIKRHQEQEQAKPIAGTASKQQPLASAKPKKENVPPVPSGTEPRTNGGGATDDVSTKMSRLLSRVQPKVAAPVQQRTIPYASFPLEGENVKIAFVAEKQLYVYRSGPEEDGQPNRYIAFVKRSIECARTVQGKLTCAPKVDDIVFAPFDGVFYRAVVRSCGGTDDPASTHVQVYYPDFGNTQTVPHWNELKQIPDPAIKYGTCYTHAVTIDGVPAFTPTVRNFLAALQELDEFELTKVEDDPADRSVRAVDMRHVQALYVLSDKIREIANKAAADPVKGGADVNEPEIPDPAAYEPVKLDDLIDCDLENGKENELVIIDASELSDGKLSVVRKSDSLALADTLGDCERYGALDPNPYRLLLGSVCLVQYDTEWCRAVPLGFDSDGQAQCYLLDMGIMCQLDTEDVECRRYPTKLDRRLYVVECTVDNPEMLETDGKCESLCGKIIKAMVTYQNDFAQLKVLSISG